MIPLTRRDFLKRSFTYTAAVAVAAAWPVRVRAQAARRVFDVRDYGAVGDGTTPDTAAIQRALDEAAAAGGNAQVLLRGGKRYMIGALTLKGGIEFHLADDAELVVATRPEDFAGRAALNADGAQGLRITGTGTINGRSAAFMDHYDEADEWWRPKGFRPRLAILTGCKDLEVSGVTFKDAPSWTLHLLGCERVLVDGINIRNQLQVPNCDGIDPDHCRDLEIKRCHIVCGDDAIVIKTTRQGVAHGPSSRIRVSDCILETQDAGLKIGTETVQDISDVRFERCEIRQSCRGLCIQLRDEGNISNVEFRDIRFVAQNFSSPWWGRGEAISFTAIPRTAGAKVGTLSDVRVVNVSGRAENSVRVSGSSESKVRDVRFENVDLMLDRWTKYSGGVWDNRPTSAMVGLEPHGTPAFSVRDAEGVTFKNCHVTWGKNVPEGFSYALEAERVAGLDTSGLTGTAAHPQRDPAVKVI